MIKVRIVPSGWLDEKYVVEYKRFLFWRKGFKFFHNSESCNKPFSKDEVIEKAKELYNILNFKLPEVEE